MADDGGRIVRWARANMPTREGLAQNRWIKPFGKRVLHSEFWRFTRRSVPRGVAIGLLVGIFVMVPGLQIIGSALLCIPFRGNIPVAALMTFLSNPLTTPFILTASYMVGSSLGMGGHAGVPGRSASAAQWVTWLFSDAAIATVSGLFIIAVVSAVIGYFASILVWRQWTARKWRRRARREPMDV